MIAHIPTVSVNTSKNAWQEPSNFGAGDFHQKDNFITLQFTGFKINNATFRHTNKMGKQF